jgi:oxygen-independent coproporphyrinogen-3 oxidase
MGRGGVLDIIGDYCRRTSEEHSHAYYGCELDIEEQKRRYLLKSLLRCEGLELEGYREFLASHVLDDFPQLTELLERGYAYQVDGRLRLTAAGLELSDVIGPWLWSASVRERMNGFVLT